MKKRLEKLMTKRKAKVEAMRALLDVAESEDRSLTVEEGEQYDAYEVERKALASDIARVEAQIVEEKRLDEPQRPPLHGSVGGDRGDDEDSPADTYRQAFWNMTKPSAVLNSDESRALSLGSLPSAGYLAPTKFAENVIKKATELSYIRNIATVSTSESNEEIYVEADVGTAVWVAEGSAIDADDPSLSKLTFSAHKVQKLVKVTNELLQDSMGKVEDYVAHSYNKAITKTEELSFVSGTGVGQPKGFLLDAELGATSASPTTLSYDEVIGMQETLLEEYHIDAVYMMNQKTKSMIRKMKGSDGHYLWKPDANGHYTNIDGFPVVINGYMPDATTGKTPIVFGDFSYYDIKDRLYMDVVVLKELYVAEGKTGFLITKRVDAMLVMPEAIKKLTMA